MTYRELIQSLLSSEAGLEAEVVFTDTKSNQRFKVTSVGYIEDEYTVNLNNTDDF